MSDLSPKRGADLLKELCENYRPSVFHPGDRFSFRGAAAGVDSAGWAGRLESWLLPPVSSLVPRAAVHGTSLSWIL